MHNNNGNFFHGYFVISKKCRLPSIFFSDSNSPCQDLLFLYCCKRYVQITFVSGSIVRKDGSSQYRGIFAPFMVIIREKQISLRASSLLASREKFEVVCPHPSPLAADLKESLLAG